MDKNKVENRINLMGGLGNQLFQLAFGLAATRTGKLEIVTAYGSPRRNLGGCPEIADFVLPECVLINPYRRNRLISKLINLQLVRSISLNRGSFSDFFLRKVLNCFLSIKFKSRCSILVGSNVGFTDIPLPVKSKFIVGYFQSWKWLRDPEVQRIMRDLRPRLESETIRRYFEIAKMEKPLLLHVRLGDYKNEAGIGLLGLPYYQRALSEMGTLRGDYETVWVFSDEVREAEKFLEPLNLDRVRFIDENISSVETLELMRLCVGYIIANSTFSFWGAFLSKSNRPIVIAPEPWFQNAESPKSLLPDDWIRIPTK